jgi:4-hydroxy-3-methylbut-2-enyl diphosphate reductase IspH
VSPAVRTEAAERGLEVIDATCPLVTKVHVEARRFAARGDTVILIGHAGHEEVEGTLGETPDQTVLVQTVEEVAELKRSPWNRTVTVVERETTRETVHFTLPPAVRGKISGSTALHVDGGGVVWPQRLMGW